MLLRPTKYLEECCERFIQDQNSSLLESETNSSEPAEETLQSSLSCCILTPVAYEYDVFANNLIPVYAFKSYSNSSSASVDTNESRLMLKQSQPHFELNYSALDFPRDVWNTKEAWEISIKTTAVIPLMIIAILGNFSVIRIVLKKNSLRRNPINLFICNMSIADLTCALLLPWIFLITDFYQRYVLGGFICKYDGFVLISLMLTSVFTLSFISFDRLLAVLLPFKGRMRPKIAKWVIIAIWIAACGISSPFIVLRSYKERQWKDFHETYCTEDVKRMKPYWLVLVVLLVWLPLLILTISFTAIVIKLDKLEKRQREQPISQIKHKSKVIRMLFLVVLCFSICWIPFTALIFIRNYNTSHASAIVVTEWFRILFFIAHYLVILNSALNPIIYGLLNDNLRRELKQYGLPSCLKKRSTVEVSTVLPNGKIGIVDQTKQKPTRLEKVAAKYGVSLPKSSSSTPSLSFFDRRNSALLDLGLPVPDILSTSSDSFKINYEIFTPSNQLSSI